MEVNILRASITPNEDGRAFVIFDGDDLGIEDALTYLRESGVNVILPSQKIIRDEERCTDCTASSNRSLPSPEPSLMNKSS